MKPTEVEDCFTEDIMQDCHDDQNCNKFGDSTGELCDI